ncbi:MAG: aspartate--tRNA ligase [Chthoniobacterales bacterium]|nr:aspartate--tRNA ligase [Chthoniobacterales bacterium]
MHYRDCSCGALRSSDISRHVTLSGWIAARRDHGGVIFIDLRDRDGITQVVFRPELHPIAATAAHTLRCEDVVTLSGQVVARLPGTENKELSTGEVELVASELVILNRSEVPPFPMEERIENEDLRLKYRYLDLRRPEMTGNIRLRHRVTKIIRDDLDEHGFWEIETPILFKSTPEGARDFLVPARLVPGSFYALPQAPQQYKQLLMVSGMDRYFQIARCFRDEDLRADRQPEFTQVDIEASFTSREEIFALIETMFQKVFRAARCVEIQTPFLRLTYKEAMNRFGSDKPDMRFGMEIEDVGAIFEKTQFKVFQSALDSGGVIKALNAKGFASVTTGQIETLTEVAKNAGAKGLAFIKIENGEWKSPIVKFFSEEEKQALAAQLNIEEGDLILFGADTWETSCTALGRVRLRVAELQKIPIDREQLAFLWVIDMPLLAYSAEEKKWNAVHHPFTRPKAEDQALLDAGKFGEVRAEAYDIVLNGMELGGGSLRIHENELQTQIFKALGIDPEKQEELFGHLLKAFRYGAPPHGGIALGLDRLISLLAYESSIRDVIAFPKNNRGMELMTGAPSPADPKDLRVLSIASTVKIASQ